MKRVVQASSFADPADLIAFKRAKARGLSDIEAFKFGDNCVGKWGDPTGEGTGPSCALPPEDWRPLGDKAHLAQVRVFANGRSVVCLLKDTMPKRANCKAAQLDLNPDACEALGLTPPVMVAASWEWV